MTYCIACLSVWWNRQRRLTQIWRTTYLAAVPGTTDSKERTRASIMARTCHTTIMITVFTFDRRVVSCTYSPWQTSCKLHFLRHICQTTRSPSLLHRTPPTADAMCVLKVNWASTRCIWIPDRQNIMYRMYVMTFTATQTQSKAQRHTKTPACWIAHARVSTPCTNHVTAAQLHTKFAYHNEHTQCISVHSKIQPCQTSKIRWTQRA